MLIGKIRLFNLKKQIIKDKHLQMRQKVYLLKIKDRSLYKKKVDMILFIQK